MSISRIPQKQVTGTFKEPVVIRKPITELSIPPSLPQPPKPPAAPVKVKTNSPAITTTSEISARNDSIPPSSPEIRKTKSPSKTPQRVYTRVSPEIGDPEPEPIRAEPMDTYQGGFDGMGDDFEDTSFETEDTSMEKEPDSDIVEVQEKHRPVLSRPPNPSPSRSRPIVSVVQQKRKLTVAERVRKAANARWAMYRKRQAEAKEKYIAKARPKAASHPSQTTSRPLQSTSRPLQSTPSRLLESPSPPLESGPSGPVPRSPNSARPVGLKYGGRAMSHQERGRLGGLQARENWKKRAGLPAQDVVPFPAPISLDPPMTFEERGRIGGLKKWENTRKKQNNGKDNPSVSPIQPETPAQRHAAHSSTSSPSPRALPQEHSVQAQSVQAQAEARSVGRSRFKSTPVHSSPVNARSKSTEDALKGVRKSASPIRKRPRQERINKLLTGFFKGTFWDPPKEKRRASRPPLELELSGSSFVAKRRRISKFVDDEEDDNDGEEVVDVQRSSPQVEVRTEKVTRVEKRRVRRIDKGVVKQVDKGVVRMEVSREIYDFSD